MSRCAPQNAFSTFSAPTSTICPTPSAASCGRSLFMTRGRGGARTRSIHGAGAASECEHLTVISPPAIATISEVPTGPSSSPVLSVCPISPCSTPRTCSARGPEKVQRPSRISNFSNSILFIARCPPRSRVCATTKGIPRSPCRVRGSAIRRIRGAPGRAPRVRNRGSR